MQFLGVSMRGVLHENVVSERGTSTSILEYARALRAYEGIEIDLAFHRDRQHNPRILEIWRNEFETIEYSSSKELTQRVRAIGADFLYLRRAGFPEDPYVDGPKLLVHSVFQVYKPHGHAYAYISSWLADAVRRNLLLRLKFEVDPGMPGSVLSRVIPWPARHQFPVPANARSFDHVPLITARHDPQVDLRSRLGIPSEAFVLGSLSGATEFNIPFVRQWIPSFLDMSDSNFFLGPNLKPFIEHPRAIFLPTLVGGPDKADYLQAIDAMLHARLMGESFGNAICEALMAGRPVLSWSGGHDQNHVAILRDSGWLYANTHELTQLVRHLSSGQINNEERARGLVQDFKPKAVAATFRSVFDV